MRTRERHRLYKKILAYVQENGFRWGLCKAFRDCLEEYYSYDSPSMEERFEKEMPEIQKHKPKRLVGMYWFSLNEKGNKKRIEILKQAIEETKPDIIKRLKKKYIKEWNERTKSKVKKHENKRRKT